MQDGKSSLKVSADYEEAPDKAAFKTNEGRHNDILRRICFANFDFSLTPMIHD
jgi:hypothetical protein